MTKEIRTEAASFFEALPTSMAQLFRFDVVVPHVPVPILPVTTLKRLDASCPFELMVLAMVVFRAHFEAVEPEARHSTM